MSDGLNLPPPFRLVSLRESGDAFSYACANAPALGAGTLVWTRRFDLAEFAVVLEPNESLRTARRAFLLGMNALIEALAAVSPPQMPISLDWPDAIRVDGVLVGGGRLGWPDGAPEEQEPEWLVFAAMLRTALLQAADPGDRPGRVSAGALGAYARSLLFIPSSPGSTRRSKSLAERSHANLDHRVSTLRVGPAMTEELVRAALAAQIAAEVILLVAEHQPDHG